MKRILRRRARLESVERAGSKGESLRYKITARYLGYGVVLLGFGALEG